MPFSSDRRPARPALAALLALLVPALLGVDWPDLSRPARRVKGGSLDAAVVVGVENYAFVSAIPGARENAEAWLDYLVKTRNVPLENVTLLIDRDATVQELRREAEQAAKAVKKGGTLWFVFIGHGAPSAEREDGLLVGFDAQQRARSIEERSLPQAELLRTLEASRASRIHVFLDACFSGRSRSGPLVPSLQPLIVTSQRPSSDRRTILFTAARGDEFAGPLPGAARPAFSYLALGGLRGWADSDQNGKVTAEELHGYVSHAMRVLVRDRTQRPTLSGEGDVALARSPREPKPDLTELVKQAARERSATASPRAPRMTGPSVEPQQPVAHFERNAAGYRVRSADVVERSSHEAAVRLDSSDDEQSLRAVVDARVPGRSAVPDPDFRTEVKVASTRFLNGEDRALSVVASRVAAEAEPGSDRDSVESVLFEAGTKEQVSHAVGGQPYLCTVGPQAAEFCTWHLSGRNVGWRPLSKTLPTSSRVNLVCGFAADGSRAGGACSVHPRNSRESEWYVAPRRHTGSRARRARSEPRSEQRRRKQEARDGSVAALAHARTLDALNRLIGQSPDSCNLHSDGHYTCMWRASRATYGHALLAATIDTDRKVHLSCQLPEDGSDRRRDSCYVVIGG